MPVSQYFPLQRIMIVKTSLIILLSIVVLAGSSWISFPLYPVPVTMQTFALLVVGALLGPVLGGVTVVCWLLLAAAGLPLLSGGGGGLDAFAGPTAGYLWSFPFAAIWAGWAFRLAQHGPRPFLGLIGAGLVGHAICLVPGALWLAVSISPAVGFWQGFVPFLIGAVVKSLMAAAAVHLAGTRWRHVFAVKRAVGD